MRITSSRAALLAVAVSSALMVAATGPTWSQGAGTDASVKASPAKVADSSKVKSLAEMKALYRRPETIPFPKDNPYTLAKADLGKKLYFDTRLSAANVLSCATCHSPAYGWGDGQPTGVGHGMKKLGRRSPTIINAAFGDIFMWDGRAGSLEAQALGPVQADVEMNMSLDKLLVKLDAIEGYHPLFEAAFPGKPMASENIAKAIAVYERTVVSGRARFDDWIDGDEKAISESAKRGFVLFNTKGNCMQCHSGWNFTDDSFHDLGLAGSDIGRAKIAPGVEKMMYAFKTPGLREISLRGPYMHDGSVANLDAVVEHYNSGGIDRPSRSADIKPLNLSKQESKDLVEFMMTLTGDAVPTPLPVLPR